MHAWRGKYLCRSARVLFCNFFSILKIEVFNAIVVISILFPAGAIVFGYSNIFVTSPSPENLKTLFEFVEKGLQAVGYSDAEYSVRRASEEDLNKSVTRITVSRDHRQVYSGKAKKLNYWLCFRVLDPWICTKFIYVVIVLNNFQ